MKSFITQYWKTLLFFGIIGLVGGFFVGIYLLDSYPAEIQKQLIAELAEQGLGDIPVNIALGAITASQALFYGIVLGALGIWLAKKVGLWKDERSFTKKPLLASALVSVFGGSVMILSDVLFFGSFSEVIKSSYAVKPTIPYLAATVTYGAVIEEIMLRLFTMSLTAFVLHRLFQKNKELPSDSILIIANILSALLFAAGHLPATVTTIGSSPIIILRCFLLNGGIGLLFGRLYRKYGLRYAMIAHGGCHIISKLIWILFL